MRVPLAPRFAGGGGPGASSCKLNTGPEQMDNVNANEDPIMRERGEPDRVEY
jgi:hypothetical protein